MARLVLTVGPVVCFLAGWLVAIPLPMFVRLSWGADNAGAGASSPLWRLALHHPRLVPMVVAFGALTSLFCANACRHYCKSNPTERGCRVALVTAVIATAMWLLGLAFATPLLLW